MSVDYKNKEECFLSVVAYAHNNEKEINEFIHRVYRCLCNEFKNFEIIIVNDASTDDTEKKIKENEVQMPITLINMSYYQGLEASIIAGIDIAIGDMIFEFDSVHITYKLDEIINVYHKSQEGYDIVSASPNANVHIGSRIFYGIFNHYFDTNISVRTEAFRLLSRRAVNRINSMSASIPYRKAAYIKSGLPMCCVKYDVVAKYQTATIEEKKSNRHIAVDAMILYTDAAYKISMFFSALMIIFTLVCSAYIIIVYLGGKYVPGYVSTFALVSFGFLGINIMLAILIKYASLILKEVFLKKKYIVKNVEKI